MLPVGGCQGKKGLAILYDRREQKTGAGFPWYQPPDIRSTAASDKSEPKTRWPIKHRENVSQKGWPDIYCHPDRALHHGGNRDCFIELRNGFANRRQLVSPRRG